MFYTVQSNSNCPPPYYLMLESEQDLDPVKGNSFLLPFDFQIMSWNIRRMLVMSEEVFIKQTCMCCLIRSKATTFSAPLGIMTSAYFFVGRQNSSKAGLTSVVYWCSTWARSLPRSSISLKARLYYYLVQCIVFDTDVTTLLALYRRLYLQTASG